MIHHCIWEYTLPRLVLIPKLLGVCLELLSALIPSDPDRGEKLLKIHPFLDRTRHGTRPSPVHLTDLVYIGDLAALSYQTSLRSIPVLPTLSKTLIQVGADDALVKFRASNIFHAI